MRFLFDFTLQTIFLLILVSNVRDGVSLTDAVTSVVSGVTGDTSEPTSGTPNDGNSDPNKYVVTDGDYGESEYFTLEDLPECGLNEYYEFCGSSCLETCKAFRYNLTAPGDCEELCEVGCFCKPGFRRHPSTGACLLESCCPDEDPNVYFPCKDTVKYCGGLYEVYRQEFNECLESCDMRPEVCSEDVLHRGCFCEDGYKRNYHGVCVPEAQCYYKEDGYINQTKEYSKLTKDYDVKNYDDKNYDVKNHDVKVNDDVKTYNIKVSDD